ncbi:BTB/POZ and MATH domain-containing protein 2-like [Triticum urartu]|uniref:BTB/POZ and MATH domain-containing protein 2-like n=1 Tax=Triticum urartu TaxID=4572 RepID=UPI0020448158|nr:BTB/POZ and MATH domain-containing protein 2-like [Triticum urartu]
MSFAGVSVSANGKLLGSPTSPTTASDSTIGYHLLVVEGYSRINRSIAINSRYFTVAGRHWSILYHPNGRKNHDMDGPGSLCLYLAEEGGKPVKAQFEFSFIDGSDQPATTCNHAHAQELFEFQDWNHIPHEKLIKREALEKHLKGDSFTVRCDVIVVAGDVIPTTTSPFITVPPSDMQQNFTDLLVAGEGTDVVFQVGNEALAAHQCILAARSTVFRAALFGPMKKGTSPTVVQVDDMNGTVFKAMLGFIYGDTLPFPAADENEGVLLQHLLVAADRYDLRRLRLMCEKKLCEHIRVGTATTILALADLHHCDGLKKACYEFLRYPANLRAVVETEGFEHLCSSCPTLMKDMLLGVLPPN